MRSARELLWMLGELLWGARAPALGPEDEEDPEPEGDGGDAPSPAAVCGS